MMISDSALQAIAKAAKFCQKVRSELANYNTIAKDDGSPVTIADYGSQAIVCSVLQNLPIVAEEDFSDLQSRPYLLNSVRQAVSDFIPEAAFDLAISIRTNDTATPFWTLDPIDGTKGFLRNDQYAIALALIEAGEVTQALLACPAMHYRNHHGLIFAASKDQGCIVYNLDLVNLGPVKCNAPADIRSARLAESVESQHTDRVTTEQVLIALGITQDPLRMDSQAKYASVACGQADFYLRLPNPAQPHYREKIWDHAAGSFIVKEAGGIVTDSYGKNLVWSVGKELPNQGIIASSCATLHEAILGALAKIRS